MNAEEGLLWIIVNVASLVVAVVVFLLGIKHSSVSADAHFYAPSNVVFTVGAQSTLGLRIRHCTCVRGR